MKYVKKISVDFLEWIKDLLSLFIVYAYFFLHSEELEVVVPCGFPFPKLVESEGHLCYVLSQ